jgi:hypothetical protein
MRIEYPSANLYSTYTMYNPADVRSNILNDIMLSYNLYNYQILGLNGVGAGDGCKSLTGTCVIFFPRRVCVVVVSNISGLDPKSLIFGISCDRLRVEVI